MMSLDMPEGSVVRRWEGIMMSLDMRGLLEEFAWYYFLLWRGCYRVSNEKSYKNFCKCVDKA